MPFQSLRKRLSVLSENINCRISIDPKTLMYVIDSAVHASAYFVLQEFPDNRDSVAGSTRHEKDDGEIFDSHR